MYSVDRCISHLCLHAYIVLYLCSYSNQKMNKKRELGRESMADQVMRDQEVAKLTNLKNYTDTQYKENSSTRHHKF